MSLKERILPTNRAPWTDTLGIGAILLLLGILYGVFGNAQEVETHGRSAVLWMVRRWSGSGGDLSHAWIIPIVSAAAVWRLRADFAKATRKGSVWGLVLIVLSLILHWVGVRSQLTRLSLLSLIGLLWAMPLYFMGWQFARLLIFPCSYLVFCIPLSFLNNITVPLRLMASTISTALLNGLGIESVQRGTAIFSTAGKGFNFDVAAPCSGLRSLLVMVALTSAYAWFVQRGLVRKWALFLCAVPLAIAGNVARILGIALVAHVFGEEPALGLYHDYSGLIVFVVAVLMMMGASAAINRVKPRLPWKNCRNEKS